MAKVNHFTAYVDKVIQHFTVSKSCCI